MPLTVRNLTRDTCLGNNIEVADRPLRRMIGLLGTSVLLPQCGLLIFPTQAVHTFGMKYPLDLVFLNRKRRVVGVRSALKPNRFSKLYWRAECVLELPAGTIQATGTGLGDQIDWRRDDESWGDLAPDQQR